MAQNWVPVTEEDKNKSYYKYYLEEMTDAPPEHYQKVLAGPIDPAKALPFKDRNRLFDPGYFEEEIGYCVMPDGTGYISNLVKMPGVTGEMFDWWFAWHGLDNLRYTIWDHEDHYRAESMQKEKGRNKLLSYKERYWDTSHRIYEDVGNGPQNILINFKNPGDLGYDVSKIGTPACSTIVCSNGMCHFVRESEGGVELRTRFWMGYVYQKGKVIKTIPDGVRIPEQPLRALNLHNIKEFTNLAALLPRIFPEERDNF
jgi:phloretin hydrolase